MCVIDHPAADLSWVGDGFCDDAVNIEICNYDGGDCCGVQVDTSYCQICECFDEETNEECSIPNLVGDGICDDQANFPICNYDNGDCCGGDISNVTCTLCECKLQECEANDTALIGDGFCHDITNVRACDFDGGDCCGDDIKTEFCKVCTCHLGNLLLYINPLLQKNLCFDRICRFNWEQP